MGDHRALERTQRLRFATGALGGIRPAFQVRRRQRPGATRGAVRRLERGDRRLPLARLIGAPGGLEVGHGFAGGGLVAGDRGAETVAVAGEGPDAVAGAARLQRGPRQAHRPLQGAVRHDRVGPERVQQLLLADDPVAVPDQVEQQVEHLRLQRQLAALEPELAPRRVELVAAESVHHR